MTKNTSVALGEHFDTYISEKLKSGKYRTASEVIREGLRKMETEDTKLEVLRKILEEGEQDIKEGRVSEFSLDSIFEEIEIRKANKAVKC